MIQPSKESPGRVETSNRRRQEMVRISFVVGGGKLVRQMLGRFNWRYPCIYTCVKICFTFLENMCLHVWRFFFTLFLTLYHLGGFVFTFSRLLTSLLPLFTRFIHPRWLAGFLPSTVPGPSRGVLGYCFLPVIEKPIGGGICTIFFWITGRGSPVPNIQKWGKIQVQIHSCM